MRMGGEALKAAGMGTVLTALDTWLLNGPFLGRWGLLASVFLATLGWFAGTAIVHRAVVTARARAARRARFWTMAIVASLATFGLLVASLLFPTTAEATLGDIAGHLAFVFGLATTIRVLVYAAARGFSADPPEDGKNPEPPRSSVR